MYRREKPFPKNGRARLARKAFKILNQDEEWIYVELKDGRQCQVRKHPKRGSFRDEWGFRTRPITEQDKACAKGSVMGFAAPGGGAPRMVRNVGDSLHFVMNERWLAKRMSAILDTGYKADFWECVRNQGDPNKKYRWKGSRKEFLRIADSFQSTLIP